MEFHPSFSKVAVAIEESDSVTQILRGERRQSPQNEAETSTDPRLQRIRHNGFRSARGAGEPPHLQDQGAQGCKSGKPFLRFVLTIVDRETRLSHRHREEIPEEMARRCRFPARCPDDRRSPPALHLCGRAARAKAKMVRNHGVPVHERYPARRSLVLRQ